MSSFARLTLLVGIAACAFGAGMVQAQSSPPAEAAAPADLAPSGTSGLSDINELLQGEDAILSGAGVTYDPENRRDPFKSLLIANEQSEQKRVRPPGIPGLLIDELQITGVFRTAAGYVVQVQSAEREKSFLLKQGDQLFDGDVVRISPNEVVFKQIVQDPTALKPFREVVKTLRPEGS